VYTEKVRPGGPQLGKSLQRIRENSQNPSTKAAQTVRRKNRKKWLRLGQRRLAKPKRSVHRSGLML